jgi:hypothetical protein
MSQENMEAARELFEQWRRGDFSGIDALPDDFEVVASCGATFSSSQKLPQSRRAVGVRRRRWRRVEIVRRSSAAFAPSPLAGSVE